MPLFKKNNSHVARLLENLNEITEADKPAGWVRVLNAAIGGLTDLGFSKRGDYLLVISSQGRGVYESDSGEKVARDYEPYGDWFDSQRLRCVGIGPIADECVVTSGIHGGGLPRTNQYGESIEVVAPRWPEYDLYFCRNGKSAMVAGHSSHCLRLDSGDLQVYGFSWCGKYLISATANGLILWKRLLHSE